LGGTGLSGASVLNRTTALLVALALSTGAAHAHRDRILSLRADGAIPELPAPYADTRLRIDYSTTSAGRVSQLSFTSGKRSTTVPSCLLALISRASPAGLRLTGSWYHERSSLPHYISVELRDAEAVQHQAGYTAQRFLFSLEDARLLEVSTITRLPNDQGEQSQAIPLQGGCPSRV